MFDEGISKVGWILIAVIVIVIFIAFCTPLGNQLCGLIIQNILLFSNEVAGIIQNIR